VATYYTYKTDVPLLPGQTLGFESGKGYYAAGTPTPTQATRNTTAAPSYIDQPVAAPVKTQPVAANAAQVAKNTTAYLNPTQPTSIAQTQPAPANAAQGARETTAAPTWVDQPVATPAKAQPPAANAAQVARQTTAAPSSIDQPSGTKLVARQPTAANTGQVARQTTDYPSIDQSSAARLVSTQPTSAFAAQVAMNTVAYPSVAATSSGYGTPYYTYPFEVPLETGQTLGFARGRGYYAVEKTGNLTSGGALTATQTIPAHTTPPQSGTARMHPVQPTKAGAPIDRAEPARALQGVVPAVIKITPSGDHLTITIGQRTFVNKPVKITVSGNDQVIISVQNQRAVITLTPREQREVAKLRSASVGGGKIVYPLLTVIAAKIAGLPVSLACAILEQETPPGGLNEWGHDAPPAVPGAIFTGGYDQAHNRQYPESRAQRMQLMHPSVGAKSTERHRTSKASAPRSLRRPYIKIRQANLAAHGNHSPT
jgi:hypothetical protein